MSKLAICLCLLSALVALSLGCEMVEVPGVKIVKGYDSQSPGFGLRDCKEQCLERSTCVVTEYRFTLINSHCLFASGSVSVEKDALSTVAVKSCS